MADKNVTLYSSPTCHFCKAAKELFDAHGIEYTDYNVVENAEKRREMMERSGQMGVPVIFISMPGTPADQAEMVIGFDKPKLLELLDIKE